MSIKKGDFVELDYTGILEETQEAFDTTMESVAKEKKIHNPKREYKPVIVILGENQLLPGLETYVEGKQPGEYKVSLKAEEAFGLKDPKLLKLIPLKAFTQQRIQPMVGLDVSIDGQNGVVRSVNGGRIIVDFNHPLSSKNVRYELNIKRILTDPKEKIESWFSIVGLPYKNIKVEGQKASVEFTQTIPEALIKHFQEQLQRYVGLEVTLKNPETQEPVKSQKTQ